MPKGQISDLIPRLDPLVGAEGKLERHSGLLLQYGFGVGGQRTRPHLNGTASTFAIKIRF
jgi:hypothetical protein